jgi:FkbM family methyltransferase
MAPLSRIWGRRVETLTARAAPASPSGISKKDFARHLPPDAVILEAGAHRGADTEVFADMWPEGHIHAFEPVAAVYEHLKNAVRTRSNVSTYPLALGSSVETRPMWVSGGIHDYSSSLLPPREHLNAFPEVRFDDIQEVTVTTIREWSAEHAVDRLDGLWLDMQGGELAALTGAGPLLERVRTVVLEAFLVPLYEGGPLWPEVRAWLQARGFSIRREAWGNTYGDVLLTRPSRSGCVLTRSRLPGLAFELRRELLDDP